MKKKKKIMHSVDMEK